MATYQFQTEVNQLLTLIIHSLYSNRDIFLREIISNASDALDKLKYLTVSDDRYKSVSFSPRIDISFDEEKKVLTVKDTGIGMDALLTQYSTGQVLELIPMIWKKFPLIVRKRKNTDLTQVMVLQLS